MNSENEMIQERIEDEFQKCSPGKYFKKVSIVENFTNTEVVVYKITKEDLEKFNEFLNSNLDYLRVRSWYSNESKNRLGHLFNPKDNSTPAEGLFTAAFTFFKIDQMKSEWGHPLFHLSKVGESYKETLIFVINKYGYAYMNQRGGIHPPSMFDKDSEKEFTEKQGKPFKQVIIKNPSNRSLEALQNDIWVSPYGKIRRLKSLEDLECYSIHEQIAKNFYPDEKYPADAMLKLGWIKVKVNEKDIVQGKELTQAQENMIFDLFEYDRGLN